MIVSVYLDVGLAVLVIVAALTDLATRRIPNILLLTGFCGSMLIHLFSPTRIDALLWALAGAATGLLIFLPLYILRGMAAGDVKLMAVAVCFGGVMSLLVVVTKGRLRMLIDNLSVLLLMRLASIPDAVPNQSVGSIPYGVAIASGTLFVIAQRYHWFADLASWL